MNAMTDIYYGKTPHRWAINIEDWKIDPNEQKAIEDYKAGLEKNLKGINWKTK